MCGLTGFIARRADTCAERLSVVVGEMTASLHHRGPDDSGIWVDEKTGTALGHRRLSIFDLTSEGHQPMVSPSGRFVLVYNGEVYNFAALRSELDKEGVAWRGHSDTEVILAAFDYWGVEAAVSRFVGMFAFALWDRRERELWLGRDRLGIKPLYYGWVDGSFVFASEVRALHLFPGFTAEVDRESLALFLRQGCVPAPRSIFEGIGKLPAGHLLRLPPRRVDGGLGEPVQHTFWSVGAAVERGIHHPFLGNEEDATDQLEALLGEAVALRLAADVPLGAFLSGGIDSSLVVALMQARSCRPVKTFTIASSDPRYDESNHAAEVARRLGTEHRALNVSVQEALTVVPDLAEIYDEPFADSSQLPTLLVSRLARQEVTVALTGDGGDEVFAGYIRHVWGPYLWQRLRFLPRPVRAAAAGLLASRGGGMLARIVNFMPPALRFRLPNEKIKKLAEVFVAASAAELYERLTSPRSGERFLADAKRQLSSPWSAPERCPSGADLVQQYCALDLQGYLADDILTKVDRATMSVGLEARVPLLDHRVVEFALSLPAGFKVRGGEGKWLLRQVAQRYLPAPLLNRPKTGFAIPVADWLRGGLRDWAEALLAPDCMQRGGLLDAEEVGRVWQEHLSGRKDCSPILWNVLMFVAWQRRKAGLAASRMSMTA
jgi:asparagine synthase (glutamine-hydrolysing)